MDNPTQQQIDEIILHINNAEDPASVTNVMVATVLAFLANKVKTMSTMSDLNTEASARQSSDAALDGRITALQTSLNTLMNGNVTDAIESFNEVINFLSEVTDDETLTGLLSEIDRRLTNAEDEMYTKADLDPYTSKLSYAQMPDVVLASMGSTLDNIGNDSEHSVAYRPLAGDTYWDENTQKIIYFDRTGTPRDMDLARPKLIYCNKQTNLTYRWKGTAGWQQVGGSPNQPGVSVVNGLDVGGTEVSLSAEMGKLLKQNINAVQANIVRLYNKLGNIAFWSTEDKAAAAPTALDWNTPKITVTLNKAGLSDNALIADANDTEITGTTISVDQGGSLTLKIKPRPGCAITTATVTIGGVQQTLNESGGIYTLTLFNITTAITIVFGATTDVLPQTFSISYQLTNCAQATGETNPTQVTEGQGATIKLECDSGYELTIADIMVTGATKGTLTESGGVYMLTITNATANVTITAVAALPTVKFIKGYYLTSNGGVISNAKKYQNSDPTNTDLTTLVAVSDYIQIPAPEDQTLTTISALCNWGRGCGTNTAGSEHSPAAIAYHQFFIKDNDTFIYVPNSYQGLKAGNAQGSAHSIQTYLVESGDNIVLNAYLSGNLYVRVSMFRSSSAGNLATNAFISVNSVKAFAANATPYTLVDSEDWTFDTNYDISYGTMTNCETTYAPTIISNGSTTAIVFSMDKKYELLQSNIIVTNATIVSLGNFQSTSTKSTATLILGNPTGNVTVSATATSVSAE